jgi:chitodextrinase
MAEFSLDRFKYRWRGDWSADTSYRRDDIVRVNGKSYVCLLTHTADSLFRNDLNAVQEGSNPPIPEPRWIPMTSGKMFAGNWSTSTAYNKGDIVNYQGSLYTCIKSHTSTTFTSDAPFADRSIQPTEQNWSLFVAGQQYTGGWEVDTDYGLNALVKYNGRVYKCVINHNSGSSFEDTFNNWSIFYDGYEFKNNWLPDTVYVINDLVKYGASIFRCTETHTSGARELDESKFELEMLGTEYNKDWQPNIAYNIGDVVRYGGVLYYAINNNYDKNPSDNVTFDSDDSTVYWIVMSNAYNFRPRWNTVNSETEFKIVSVQEDTVDEKATGNFYIDGVEKATLILDKGRTYIFDQSLDSNATVDDKTNPICFSIRENGIAGGGTYYEDDNPGSVIYILDGYEVSRQTYFNNFPTAVKRQVSLTIPTTETLPMYYFSGVNIALGGRITVANLPSAVNDVYAVDYKTGDIVQRGGSVYRAVRDVGIAEGDGSSIDYLDPEVWELLIPGKVFDASWVPERVYSENEVVTYLGSAYKCNLEHTSADNNFPGDNGSGYDYWDLLIEAGQPGAMLYKGDLLTYGLNREPIGDLSTLGSKRLGIGEEEQLLSIHEDSASQELEIYWRNRINDSDTIFVAEHGQDEDEYGFSWTKPFRTIRHACEYVEDNFEANSPVKIYIATGRFEEVGPISVPAGCAVMGDELRATTVAASGPKAAYQDSFKYVQAYMTRFKQLFPQLILLQTANINPENTFVQDKTGPISTTSSFAAINDLVDEYIAFIDANLGSGEEPDVTGSNTPSSIASDVYAANILSRNFELIAKEMILYAQEQYPDDTIPEAEIRSDVRHFLRALKRDLSYSGNWAIQMSARRFYNSVLGSRTTDLLYMRDNTGLRNMTTEGLRGVLNPPGVFSQYQRPTGGSLVSLDPGWGPDDERCWIKTRSPYMQGVTNIGTACVGMKIDGALHNGGNKSAVANDFTQVLSDGIGAWILNNARAELVSVFTYYCQVGYLAEAGGVIRSANGNNSYGSFGSIAEGNDPNEVPAVATVNNQINEAVVNNAVAGGSNDELLVFEYANCGKHYSYADADIVGAGDDADVEYSDFRDGALFEARLINTKGSGSKGGSNYTIRQNSAQITLAGTDRIILNNNEETQFEEEILGMRIVLFAGTGVGQYGIIESYDQPSKVLTVIKESTGEPGWDHIIPGWPIETSLDSTTQYRIEPLLTCAAPPFETDYSPLPNSREWADLSYGGTTATYTNIRLDSGTGQVDEEAASIQAVITITRSGDQYSTSLVNPGAGYAVGDEFVIEGTLLGGSTPENNATVTVTANSEDSTNSIISLSITGTPRGNRWVALTTNGIFAYSDDGETWGEGQLPFTGTFVRIIAAQNKFIALATDDNKVAYSLDGQTWTQRSLPATAKWVDIVYGNAATLGNVGRFVIVGENSDVALHSTDGLVWGQSNLPAGDDSSGDQWQGVAYGQGRFIAITGGQSKNVAYSENGVTWSSYTNVLPDVTADYIDLVYGNNKFMAMDSDGNTAFSLDRGETWIVGAPAPTIDGSTLMVWKRLKYYQGVFLAICDTGGRTIGLDATTGPTSFFATTECGTVWHERSFDYERLWSACAFATIDGLPTWLVLSDNEINSAVAKVNVGARAKARADITAGSFNFIKIWDPGSGYTGDNLPEITVVDNSFVTAVEYDLRISTGVLSQPDFILRGAGYRTSTSTITISGNGYGDIIPEDNEVVLSGVPLPIPGPGVQLRFTGILDETTDDPNDLKLFVGVAATDLGDDGSGNGTRLVRFTISPKLDNEYNLAHGTTVTLSRRYSQCRISGHDFLDIGTGNFEQTNYPELYAGGAYFVSAPENEVTEVDGGRVFYVSTDQEGNFRAGELFGVNQATGIVTISAEFFDLDGLSALSLGGVRLGGTGTVVSEFSTDPTFSADSNNIIPTQKAIATFLADRLSVGGSDLETNTITAGQVKIGTSENIVDILGGGYLNIPRRVTFDGVDALGNETNVQGNMLAQMLFMRGNRPDEQ